MKKFIPKLFIIISIVLVVLIGKSVIDHKTVDYKTIVNESLMSFYVNGHVKELQPIIDLLEEYEDDDVIRADIQSSSLSIVGSWYTYLDEKYFCDISNLNSCKAQLDEFIILNNKLNNLYDFKCEDGFTIIIPSSYTNLKNQGIKKVEGLEKIIKNPSAKNPLTSEEIRLRKCLVAVDCDNCRDGVCKCYYIDEDKNREEISCKKDVQQ